MARGWMVEQAAQEAIASAEVVEVATQMETLQAGQVMAQVEAVRLAIAPELILLVALQTEASL